MKLNRRAMLGGAAASLAAGGALAQSSPPIRVRSSCTSAAGKAQLAVLAQAMPELRRSGAWQRQVAIHADMFRNQHHRNWRFLPWHRAQLLWFEQLVGDAAGRPFTLPYWDWTRLEPLPNELYDLPNLRVSGRLARRGQRVPRALQDSRFQGRMRDRVDRFLGTQLTGGQAYGGSCENSGHNAMHNFVGGPMNSVERAPEDPAFWLHHCNVDRVWASWDMFRREDYPERWLNESIGGFERLRGAPPPFVRARTLTDTTRTAFPYRYDDLLGELIVFAGAPTEEVVTRTLRIQGGPPCTSRQTFEIDEAIRTVMARDPGPGFWSFEAVVETTPIVVDPLQTTFAISDGQAGSEPIRSAVFNSEHHGASAQRIDVSDLIPDGGGEPGRRAPLTLFSEDVFERGGRPMLFDQSVLVLTGVKKRERSFGGPVAPGQ